MRLNEEKLLQQKQIVNKWLENHFKGTCMAPTGFGKSFVGVLLIRSQNERHPERTTMIVVPTRALKCQWEANIRQFGLLNTTVEVINTVIRKRYYVNLLVLDEIHRYAAPTFANIFNMVSYNFILGLTATFARSDGKHEILAQKAPVIFEMKLREAKKKGYVSDFTIYNLGINTNIPDWITYSNIDKKYNYYFQWFGYDFDLALQCAQNDAIADVFAKEINVAKNDVRKNAVNFLRVMQKRKQLLIENPAKLPVIKQIFEKFKTKSIIFSETTEFANAIADTIPGCVALHTKTPLKLRQELLDEFSNPDGKIKLISTARMYDEGIDLPDIEMAVIASGTGSSRQSIQRVGRAIRFAEGKDAIIVNIYMKNTQEENWVQKRTVGMQPMWIESIDQIGQKNGSATRQAVKYKIELFK